MPGFDHNLNERGTIYALNACLLRYVPFSYLLNILHYLAAEICPSAILSMKRNLI